MSLRAKTILITGILLLAFFILLRRHSKKDFKNTDEVKNPKETSDVSTQKFSSEPTKPKPKSTSPNSSSQSSKKPPSNVADAGLIKLRYMESESGEKFIKVRVEKHPVCHPGDLEAMIKAVGKNGNMLVSLEPLGGEGNRIQKTVTMADIERGITFDLPVKPAKSAVYGIFLCEDSASSKACLGKPAANFNSIIGNPNAGDDAKNVVYYFQSTFLQPDSHLLYTGDAPGIGSVRDYIQANGGTSADDTHLLQAKRLIRGVNSLPAKVLINDSGILITLPIAANLEHLCANPERQ